MRIDARADDYCGGWRLWDAERCEFPMGIVWADDETHQYGAYVSPHSNTETIAHQARRIVIYLERRFILINPIADEDDTPRDVVSEVELTA